MNERRLSYRDRARAIIVDAIETRAIVEATHDPRDGKLPNFRRVLSMMYPFGPRKYWPYKVWCDEVARQLGEERGRIRPRRRKAKGRVYCKEQVAMPWGPR